MYVKLSDHNLLYIALPLQLREIDTSLTFNCGQQDQVCAHPDLTAQGDNSGQGLGRVGRGRGMGCLMGFGFHCIKIIFLVKCLFICTLFVIFLCLGRTRRKAVKL